MPASCQTFRVLPFFATWNPHSFRNFLPALLVLLNLNLALSAGLHSSKVSRPPKQKTQFDRVLEGLDLFHGNSDVDFAVPSLGNSNPNAIAVVFGIEKYRKAPDATYARRDAETFKKYVLNVFGVPNNPRNLYALSEGATLAEFNRVFSKGGWVAQNLNEDSDVLIYFSGHGTPDLNEKTAYLVPEDGDPNYANETCYPVEELIKFLSGLNCRSITFFLDACFSGIDRNNRMILSLIRPLMIPVKIKQQPGKKLLFLSASEAYQVSSGSAEKRHGLFSYFLMKALRGDADYNKDRILTAGELYEYVKKNVSESASKMNRVQTPVMLGDPERVVVSYEKN